MPKESSSLIVRRWKALHIPLTPARTSVIVRPRTHTSTFVTPHFMDIFNNPCCFRTMDPHLAFSVIMRLVMTMVLGSSSRCRHLLFTTTFVYPVLTHFEMSKLFWSLCLFHLNTICLIMSFNHLSHVAVGKGLNLRFFSVTSCWR